MMTCRTGASPVLTLLALVGAGCDGPSTQAGSRNDEVPVVAATEVVRIGSLDDPDYAFSHPTALAVADDGRLVSGHRQGPEVRRFAPDGTALGTLGQAGEGPGEYQAIGSISIDGDSVWVLDRRAYRFIAYDLDSGDVLRSVTIPVGASRFDDRMVTPSARLGPDLYLGDPVAYSQLVASGEITHRHLLLLDAEGRQIDTLPPVEFGRNTWAIERENGAMYTAQPFADGPLSAVLPDVSLLVLDREVPEDGTYRPLRLSRLSRDADTLWTREIDFEVRPVDASEADSIVEMRIPDRPPFSDGRAGMLEAGRRSLYLPPYRPGATALFVDDDGRAWVRPPYEPDEPSAWWVVGPDGQPIARVLVPNDVTLRAGRGSRVWGVRVGEFDVPYIVGLDVDFP